MTQLALRTISTVEELREHLDALNDEGNDPTAVGVDANGAPFLITLEGPYADRAEVFYGSPWSSERDWVSGLRCDDCMTHHAFTIEDVQLPVVIMGPDSGE